MSNQSPVHVAINGANGVIGGDALKAILIPSTSELIGNIKGRERFRIAAVNDLAFANGIAAERAIEKLEELGYQKPIEMLSDNEIQVGPHRIRVFAEADPANIGYGPLVEDIADRQLTVLECTGHWNKLEDSPEGERPAAAAHLDGGATSVVVSCPAKGMNTFVMGVNDHLMTPDDRIISNASCTTNAAAPILSALIKNLKMDIEAVIVSTVHAATPACDPRNTIESKSTSAIAAIPLVLPELDGLIMDGEGTAQYVPVSEGSLLSLHVVERKNPNFGPHSPDNINVLFEALARNYDSVLSAVRDSADKNYSSKDIAGSLYSAIIDLDATHTLGNIHRIQAFYDNNTAYACRMVEIAAKLQRRQIASPLKIGSPAFEQ